MALNTNAIITAEEAQAQLRVSSLTAEKSAIIDSYINEVSSYVELYCKRKFVLQSISNELHDGGGGSVLYPRYFPLVQLSTATSPTDAQKLASLQYRDTPDNAWTDVESDIDHIFIETGDDALRSCVELYDETFRVGRRNIKISYKAGYSTVPGDVKTVVLEMVNMRWLESAQGESRLGMGNVNMSNSGANQSQTLIDLDPRWKKVLNRYRVPSI